MNSLTFSELKMWLVENKEHLKGKTVRISTARGSAPFNTLKSLGEHILSIESTYTSAKIYSYSTNGVTFRNFSDDANEITNTEIKTIEITIGGGMTSQQIMNLAKIKTLKIKNK
jgi:uncharacterized protein YigE (DUF2233 family)